MNVVVSVDELSLMNSIFRREVPGLLPAPKLFLCSPGFPYREIAPAIRDLPARQPAGTSWWSVPQCWTVRWGTKCGHILLYCSPPSPPLAPSFVLYSIDGTISFVFLVFRCTLSPDSLSVRYSRACREGRFLRMATTCVIVSARPWDARQ